MDHPFADKLMLNYASPRRRRTLTQLIDVEFWAAVGVVVALLMLDLGCIVFILLRS